MLKSQPRPKLNQLTTAEFYEWVWNAKFQKAAKERVACLYGDICRFNVVINVFLCFVMFSYNMFLCFRMFYRVLFYGSLCFLTLSHVFVFLMFFYGPTFSSGFLWHNVVLMFSFGISGWTYAAQDLVLRPQDLIKMVGLAAPSQTALRSPGN